jgi:hypothetical protein
MKCYRPNAKHKFAEMPEIQILNNPNVFSVAEWSRKKECGKYDVDRPGCPTPCYKLYRGFNWPSKL